jgi:hypothetical protein
MAHVFLTKEACGFVGGSGTKAGNVKAGGCTRAWLESKGMNPASLFQNSLLEDYEEKIKMAGIKRYTQWFCKES